MARGRTGATRPEPGDDESDGDDEFDEFGAADDFDDDDVEVDDPEWARDEPPAPKRSLLRRSRAARAEREAPADDGLPPSTLRGNEVSYGYAVAVLTVLVGILLLVDRTGKGAPKHPDPLWAALGVVGGLALAATIRRWHSRLATASVALLAGFAVSRAEVPTSLVGVRTTGFFIPAIFALWIYLRQSRADRRRRTGARAGRGGGTRAGAGSGTTSAKGGAARAVPTGGRGRPTGRYTPPKDRTPPKSGKRTR